MKRLTGLTLLLTLLLSFPVLGNAAGKEAKIKFTENKYDFGNVPEDGGEVTHEFQFTNTGDGNLIIIDASATCGCTKPKYPEKPIAPGKSGIISVTFNPKHRPGPIDKTVTVRTNGSPKKVRLRIVGNVVPSKR